MEKPVNKAGMVYLEDFAIANDKWVQKGVPTYDPEWNKRPWPWWFKLKMLLRWWYHGFFYTFWQAPSVSEGTRYERREKYPKISQWLEKRWIVKKIIR